jgi:hypothetical protein
MKTLVTALLSFLLTGLLGNWLVHKWQQANWMQQRRLLRAEQQLQDLRTLIDEIMALADSRSFRIRRLLRNLPHHGANIFPSLRKELDTATTNWNDKFNSFLARLTLFADHSFAMRLEDEIQPLFVRIAGSLDSALNNPSQFAHDMGFTASLERQLNRLKDTCSNFTATS